MRLTTRELRQIIKEEVESVMEMDEPVGASIVSAADERQRIADWLRNKARTGLREKGIDETGKAVLNALFAYADAIQNNNMNA